MKAALPQTHHDCLEKLKCPLIKQSESLKVRLEFTMRQAPKVNFKPYRFENPV